MLYGIVSQVVVVNDYNTSTNIEIEGCLSELKLNHVGVLNDLIGPCRRDIRKGYHIGFVIDLVRDSFYSRQ